MRIQELLLAALLAFAASNPASAASTAAINCGTANYEDMKDSFPCDSRWDCSHLELDLVKGRFVFRKGIKDDRWFIYHRLESEWTDVEVTKEPAASLRVFATVAGMAGVPVPSTGEGALCEGEEGEDS